MKYASNLSRTVGILLAKGDKWLFGIFAREYVETMRKKNSIGKAKTLRDFFVDIVTHQYRNLIARVELLPEGERIEGTIIHLQGGEIIEILSQETELGYQNLLAMHIGAVEVTEDETVKGFAYTLYKTEMDKHFPNLLIVGETTVQTDEPSLVQSIFTRPEIRKYLSKEIASIGIEGTAYFRDNESIPSLKKGVYFSLWPARIPNRQICERIVELCQTIFSIL